MPATILPAPNYGDEMRQSLAVLRTYMHLLPSHRQDEAFIAKFEPLVNAEIARMDTIASSLLGEIEPGTADAQNPPIVRS